MSAVLKKNKRDRQPASQALARHPGEERVAQIGQWESTTTGELCEFITSGSRDWKSYYSETGAYFIRTQDINRDHLDLSNAARVKLPDRVEGKRSRVLPGDLLITITGANVGKVALVPDQIEEAYVSQSVGLMRLKDKRFAPYLHHYLQSEECGRKQVLGSVYGIGRPVLSLQNLRDIPVVLPPLEAQRKIIAEIEKQSTRLDSGVAALHRVQANLKRYRAAVLKAACEGRLVLTEAELAKTEGRTYETGEQLLARILADRRKNWHGRGKYKEPAAPDATNLAPLPSGWAWSTAEQLSDENRSITYGVIKLGTHVIGGVPVLRSSDVRHLRLDPEDVKVISPDIANGYRRTFLRGGEVLVTVRGTLGGVTVAPTQCAGFNISREVAMLAFVEPLVAKATAIFIGSSPLQQWLMQHTKGIAYTGINIETLKKLPIPLPPLMEQARIVAEVERRLSMVEKLEAAVAANLQRATRLRQSVLHRAFAASATV